MPRSPAPVSSPHAAARRAACPNVASPRTAAPHTASSHAAARFAAARHAAAPVAALAVAVALHACGGATDASPPPSPAARPDAARRAASDVPGDVDALALAAVADDPSVAEPAIRALRTRGRAGLEALLAAHASAVRRLRAGDAAALRAADARVRAALDRVAAQRDAHASGLFWHTDLDAARAEAASTGRLVLSLRLLGRLDEERSCANSRYFRALLYPNAAVAETLRRDFVLHWSSERPAPRMIVDFGDGRRLERTLTGNSIHYVLDEGGRVLEALPGLYDAPTFLELLASARAVHAECGGRGAQAGACYAARHRREIDAIRAAWEQERARAVGQGRAPGRLPTHAVLLAAAWPAPADGASPEEPPSAAVAMRLTVGKAMVETPALQAIRPVAAGRREPVDVVDWLAFVGPRAGAALGPEVAALVALKSDPAIDPATLAARLDRLATVAAADGARNRFVMRPAVLGRLASYGAPPALEPFNARIYTEVFMTPPSDPWLGLRADDVWDGIEDLAH
jgi:hypothetical protein